VRYAVLCLYTAHLSNRDGRRWRWICMATHAANKLRRSIDLRARETRRCDGQVVGPPMVIYSSGKNKRMAAAAAPVDLSTGEKVKILYGRRRRHSWPGAREFNSAGRRQMLWLTGPDSGSAGLGTNLRSTSASTHQFHYGHPPTTHPQHPRSRLTYIMYIYYSHLAAVFRSAAAINPIIGTAAVSPVFASSPRSDSASHEEHHRGTYI